MGIYKITWWVVFLSTNIERSKEECSDRFPNSECTPIEECESLRAIIQKTHQTLDDIIFLINRNCENSRRKHTKICCPKYTKCETPDRVTGQCIHSTDCFSNSATLTRSGCEGPNNVCCLFPPRAVYQEPAVVASRSTKSLDSTCPATTMPPDPDSNCCENYGNFNKITGGDASEIDQFTWLALIEYDSGYPEEPVTNCGAALISAEYVLTAAHCVIIFGNSSKPIDRSITGVRLGEYNTANHGADCVLVEGGGTDCTDGAVSVPVRRAIAHELYQGGRDRWHDIALIQLAQMVQFTSFITPICLTSSNISASPPLNRLTVAGWGSTLTNKDVSPSFIKLYVELPLVNFNTCAARYSRLKKPQSLWHGQICAGGEPGKDSCKGDSGGPLVHFKDGRVHLVGVVSHGGFPCGGSLPGVYTNVVEYLDWIKSHIRK